MKNLICSLLGFVISLPVSAMTCVGYRAMGQKTSFDHYEISFSRSRFDEGQGVPVDVTLKHKIDFARENSNQDWMILFNGTEGRMLGNSETQITVDFTGGRLTVGPESSRVPGTIPHLQGTLELENAGTVMVSCRLN